MSVVQPNEYTLKGGNLTFTYVKHNFLGQPFVSYTEGGQTKDFFGSAVRVLETGIGTLVTVTTHMTIDSGGTEFSVLLPVIELADTTKTQAFLTDGISTSFKGPDSFPLTGVRENVQFHSHERNCKVHPDGASAGRCSQGQLGTGPILRRFCEGWGSTPFPM